MAKNPTRSWPLTVHCNRICPEVFRDSCSNLPDTFKTKVWQISSKKFCSLLCYFWINIIAVSNYRYIYKFRCFQVWKCKITKNLKPITKPPFAARKLWNPRIRGKISGLCFALSLALILHPYLVNSSALYTFIVLQFEFGFFFSSSLRPIRRHDACVFLSTFKQYQIPYYYY